MADDSQQLFIRHDVHQRGEYPDAAVRTGKGIHVGDVVDFEVQRDSFYVCQPLCEPVQPFGVGTFGIAYLVVLVHPGNVLLHIFGHVGVGQCSGLYSFCGTGGGFPDVELCLYRGCSKKEKCSGKSAEE